MQSILLEQIAHSSILQLFILLRFCEENHCQEAEQWDILRFLYEIHRLFFKSFFWSHQKSQNSKTTARYEVTGILFTFCNKTILATLLCMTKSYHLTLRMKPVHFCFHSTFWSDGLNWWTVIKTSSYTSFNGTAPATWTEAA